MSEPRREFDWGPPTWSATESYKEWIIYLFLFLLIGGGTWLLTSTTSPKEFRSQDQGRENLPPIKSQSTGMASPDLTASRSNIPNFVPVEDRRSTFMVQSGAFGDEESAKTFYLKLKDFGFNVSMALPDEQFEMYRVLLGPFQSEKEAESKARRLNELDFPSFVIESP